MASRHCCAGSTRTRACCFPALFLPVLEHDDLICMIGAWVLREALTQQQRWQAEGIALAVSVNVAARQFLDPRFMTFLEGLLAEFPDRMKGGLELEILESADIEDTASRGRGDQSLSPSRRALCTG